ncbi:MAG: DUF488 domain-containing protein [Thermomicrobium sp.]|nr:DUF488 domain-containing protein [Thermomicrobium sp.]MDW8006106.1 DUF488 domain-containing protein [Thermomicrobium sp.]
MSLTIFTIGFTKKSAERFFTLLKANGVVRMVDVRLHNTSQLAGFAKRGDLEYFLRMCAGIQEYVHLPLLAPTEQWLNAYQKKRISWEEYECAFLQLLRERQVETTVSRELLAGGCLLCSEHKPDRCHRRLVAEYFAQQWGDVRVVHLV